MSQTGEQITDEPDPVAAEALEPALVEIPLSPGRERLLIAAITVGIIAYGALGGALALAITALL